MINKNFTVKEFRFLTLNDKSDIKWKEWSRCYEYPAVIDIVKGKSGKIHNAACGGGMKCHIDFAEELSKIGIVCNSDVQNEYSDKVENFRLYDINEKFIGKELFNSVVLISTLEHIHSSKYENIINNLLEQLEINGVLVVTFDYPDANINILESILGVKCIDNGVRVSGANSICRRFRFSRLNVGIFVIEKIK